MRVILLKDVRGLGRKFEIKEVPDGHARNFLIPKGLARLATGEALSLKEAHDDHRDAAMRKLKTIADSINKLELKFEVAGNDKSVFGSVSREEIELELKRKGFPDVKVELGKSLKTIGPNVLNVDVGQRVKAKLKVVISVSDK